MNHPVTISSDSYMCLTKGDQAHTLITFGNSSKLHDYALVLLNPRQTATVRLLIMHLGYIALVFLMRDDRFSSLNGRLDQRNMHLSREALLLIASSLTT